MPCCLSSGAWPRGGRDTLRALDSFQAETKQVVSRLHKQADPAPFPGLPKPDNAAGSGSVGVIASTNFEAQSGRPTPSLALAQTGIRFHPQKMDLSAAHQAICFALVSKRKAEVSCGCATYRRTATICRRSCHATRKPGRRTADSPTLAALSSVDVHQLQRFPPLAGQAAINTKLFAADQRWSWKNL